MAGGPTIVVRFIADTKGLAAGMAAVETSGGRGSAALSKVGKTAGLVAIGIAGLGALAFKAAADFEKSMNVFQATSGATGKEMASARKEAVALGNDIKLPGVSAKDAADAMNELAKGGFNAKQSMAAARGVLLLGQAANIDYADSATIVARSLKAFGAPASEAGRYVDILAAAALKSTVGIQEIADGMSYAGAPARALGISFKDTAASLAILNDRGIVGAKAGATLGVTLTRLAAPTGAAAKAMQQLGLMTASGSSKFFDAQGHFIGMRGATDLLSRSMRGLTQEQKLQYLQTIFGTRGMRGALAVLGGGVGQWDKYSAAVGKSGAAQKLATAQTKGSAGAMEAMRNAVETLAITFGSAIAPAITAILQPLAAFFSLLSQHPKVVTALVIALGTLAVSLWAISAAFAAVGVVVGLLALGTVGVVIGVVVAAVAALAAAAYVVYANWSTISAWFTGMWAAIAAAATAAWQAIVAGAQAALAGLLAGWNAVVAAAQAVWNAIRAGAQAVWSWISSSWPLLAGILAGPFGIAVALIVTHWAQIVAAAQAAWAQIVAVVTAAWNTVRAAIVAATAAVAAAITTAWNAIRNAVTAAANAVRAAAVAAFQATTSAVTAAVNALRAAVTAAWNGVRSAVTSVIGAITGAVGTVVAAFARPGAAAHSMLSTVSAAWRGIAGAINGVVGAVSAAANRVAQAMMAPINAAKGVINAVLGRFNAIHFTIPAIHIPAVKVAGKTLFPGADIGGVSISVPNVPLLARGGVVDTPTLIMAGEGAGREIIAPENLLRSIVAERPMEVHVYIGERELTDLVRTQVVSSNTGLARTLLAGAR